jgi:deoxyribodipyrimidine photo-lyase
MACLDAFVPRAGQAYAQGRNTATAPGQQGAVSGLSPYIRHRLITEAEVLAPVLERHGPVVGEAFIREVFWRSYWKGWLELRPALWDSYKARLAACQQDRALMARAHQAMRGQTGIDCFDAWAHELTATGTLHNHTRMWFASIWCFTLELPWVVGADAFFHHLLDADAASNLLSWRWVAGSQTPGKHYVARAANIATYTQGRFAPHGRLNEIPAPIIEPNPAPLPGLPTAPPLPGGRVGVLLHEDDLGFETLELGGVVPAAVAGMAMPDTRSPQGASALAGAWTRHAVQDALTRAGACFGGKSPLLTPDDVCGWARAAELDTVLTPWAPVGWVADELNHLEQPLEAAGIRFIRHRRAWDETCWPLAQRGFFAFKTHIPALLAKLLPDTPRRSHA